MPTAHTQTARVRRRTRRPSTPDVPSLLIGAKLPTRAERARIDGYARAMGITVSELIRRAVLREMESRPANVA